MTTDEKTPEGIILGAWRTLYPDEATKQRGDAGARAQLRRAASPAEVELEPAFHEFLKRMKLGGFDFEPYRRDRRRLRRLALIAGLLATRKSSHALGRRLMQALGGTSDPSERKLKPLRFQALIAALDRDDEAEIMTTLRRALLMARDEEINLNALVHDLLYWGDDTRRCWTYDYFGQPYDAHPFTPNPISTEETAA